MIPNRADSVTAYLASTTFIGLLAIACGLPAFISEEDVDSRGSRELWVCSGFTALLMGWLHPCWLANPIAFTGLLLLLAKRPSGTMATAVASLLLGLAWLFTPFEPEVGYWVWIASFVWLLGGAFLARDLGWGQNPMDSAPSVLGVAIWIWLLTLLGALVPLLVIATILFG